MDIGTATEFLLSDGMEGKSYSVDPVPTYAGVTSHDSLEYCGKINPMELTPDEIAGIYNQHYWLAFHCDTLPDGLDFALFQAVVNVGPRAVKWLQAAAGVHADGNIGPKTLAAIAKLDRNRLINDFLATQDAYYERISVDNAQNMQYLAGWHNRVKLTRNFVGAGDALAEINQKVDVFVSNNETGAIGIGLGALIVIGIGLYFLLKAGF